MLFFWGKSGFGMDIFINFAFRKKTLCRLLSAVRLIMLMSAVWLGADRELD